MARKTLAQLKMELAREKRKEKLELERRAVKKELFRTKYRKPLRFADKVADTTVALGKSTANVARNLANNLNTEQFAVKRPKKKKRRNAMNFDPFY